MSTINKQGKITGFLYLSVAIIAFFSMGYVPLKLIVENDAAATAHNILTNNLLFRFSIVCESIIFLLEIGITALLYMMFRPVNKLLSIVAAFFRLSMTVIEGVNIINYLFVLGLINNQTYADAFGENQVNALISLFIEGHKYGTYTWQVFFGLHLIFLGYLVYKSCYMPKSLGVLVMVGSLGYLVDSYKNFLMPDNGVVGTIASILLVFSTVGELVFIFWLLFKGVKETKEFA